MLQLKRKSLRLPDGLLTKVYKNIVNGYHNENCCPNILTHPACGSKTSWKEILIMIKSKTVAFLGAYICSKVNAG